MKKSIIGLMCMSMIAGSFMGCSGKAVVETTAKETQKATETVETESVLSEEIVDAQTEEVETFKHPIEKYFPEDWAGRYIVEENEPAWSARFALNPPRSSDPLAQMSALRTFA